MHEIFYEFKEITSNTLISTINIEIILHFLAKVDSSLILYETKQVLSKSRNLNMDEEVVNTLEKIFKEKNSNVLIDGEFQMDAAINESAAKRKCPDSEIGGKCNEKN